MTDDLDFESMFEGLLPEQVREVASTMVQAGRQKTAALKAPPSQEDPLKQQEADEIAALQKRARGQDYIERKRVIQEKFAQMRQEASRQPVTDPEIEQIKDDPRALHKLYQSRLKSVRRGDIRGVAELQNQFRSYLEGI